MTLVDDLRARWEKRHLLAADRWVPTFIEDVGSAAAENVRSAALRRWLNTNPAQGLAWLGAALNRAVAGTRLRVEREHAITADSRVDLQVFADDGLATFIEVKWASEPSDAQLKRYRDDIDQRTPGTPLVLVSPIVHVVSQGGRSPSETHFAEWAQVLSFMAESQGVGSIEDDLKCTIARWREAQEAVRAAVRRPRTTVGELCEAVTWVDHVAPTGGAKRGAYSDLFRRLILAEVAESFVAVARSSSWRRCLTSKGSKSNDFQADVAPRREDELLMACPGHPEVGVALVLRFWSPYDFRNMQVRAGTAILPYLEGSERDVWDLNAARREAVFQHARRIRGGLVDALRGAGLGVEGSPNTSQWMKQSHASSFAKAHTIEAVFDCASRIANVYVGTGW